MSNVENNKDQEKESTVIDNTLGKSQRDSAHSGALTRQVREAELQSRIHGKEDGFSVIRVSREIGEVAGNLSRNLQIDIDVESDQAIKEKMKERKMAIGFISQAITDASLLTEWTRGSLERTTLVFEMLRELSTSLKQGSEASKEKLLDLHVLVQFEYTKKRIADFGHVVGEDFSNDKVKGGDIGEIDGHSTMKRHYSKVVEEEDVGYTVLKLAIKAVGDDIKNLKILLEPVSAEDETTLERLDPALTREVYNQLQKKYNEYSNSDIANESGDTPERAIKSAMKRMIENSEKAIKKAEEEKGKPNEKDLNTIRFANAIKIGAEEFENNRQKSQQNGRSKEMNQTESDKEVFTEQDRKEIESRLDRMGFI